MNRFLFTTSARALMAAEGETGGAAAPDAGGVAAAASPPASEAAAAPPVASAPAAAAPIADAAPAPVVDAKAPSVESSGKPAAEVKADAKDPATPTPDAPKDAKVEPPADTSKDAKPAEPAPADASKDAKAPDPAKEAPVEAQPPAAKTYEPFKTPDGVKLGDKELKAFTDVIGPAQLPQETAQSLVDLYLAETQRLSAEAARHQKEHWNTLNDTWKTELRNDPEMGGNRLETSLGIAKAVIEEFGGTKEQVADLIAHTVNNGMGNYVGFNRLLHNIGVKLNVFEDKIVPAQSVNPSMPKSRREILYGPPKGNGAQA